MLARWDEGLVARSAGTASSPADGRLNGTATVLFTDLVSSTELLTTLGEDAFDGLRRAHFTVLREAIARAGGIEVKTLGDGVLATFHSAAEAIGCAVGVQQAVDLHGRVADITLALRVGLALGDVIFEDGDVFGTPVVEAARLVACARPGQILATALVPMVAGGRAEVTVTDLGRLELKGLPAPVAACEVHWEPLSSPSLPLPSLLIAAGRIFVGREREMEQLQRLWSEAVAGRSQVALIAGEPGVGKTRLAAELAARVHAERATVSAGRCDEDLGVPYQPFVEALRHVVRHTPPADLGRRLGRHAGELARLVPELTELLPGLPPPLRSDPETERYRLFDAVAAWVASASTDEPLLLVFDDLQWAARPTLLLLRHVLRSHEPRRLLIVVTYRDTEVGRTHPLGELLADLRRETGVERLSLSGLDPAGVATFLEQAAGHQLGPERDELAVAIHRETEGNTFFVREVVRHLIETGGLREEQGRWATSRPVEELGIPEGVRDVVGRRLSRLSETANRALAVAAVMGLEFELAVLQSAGKLDEEAVLSALEEAVAARLVIEVQDPRPRYRFAHALVRATLYEELTGARRVLVHRRVAETLETLHAGRLDDYLPALAHHYSRAAAPHAEAAKAIDYARRAGDRALAQLAHDEAVAYYGQALEMLSVTPAAGDDRLRLGLLVARGEAERRAGDPGCRQTLLRAAHLGEELGDADMLSRAALAPLRGNLFSGVGQVGSEQVWALEAALGAVTEVDSPTRARLLAALGQELVFTGDLDRCRHLSDEALAIARRLGDPATVAAVLASRYHTICGPDTLAERRGNVIELLTAADAIGDPAFRSWALWLAYRAAIESGDVEEADRHLRVNDRLTAELGQPALRWMFCWDRNGRVLLSGDVDGAERLVEEASELGHATGQADAQLFSVAQLFQVRFEQGRLEEVESMLAKAVEGTPRMPALRAMQALLLCELGREAQARTGFDALAGADFADVPVDVYWLRTMTDAAAVCAHLGDAARAAVLYRLLAPHANQLVVAIRLVSGCVSHYLSLLATTMDRFDDAEAHFANAEAIHSRIGAPTWAARTRLEWARMLVTRGRAEDTERARALLAQALLGARELALATVERRAVAVLASCEEGQQPPAVRSGGRSG